MEFDPDFGKTGYARHLFRLRFRQLNLSQKAFAERYGIGCKVIRNLEQGICEPTAAMRLLIAAIARDPGGMAEMAQDVMEPCACHTSDHHCCDAPGG